MKKLLLILLSVLSLTIVAQEKKTITIQQPKCDNAKIGNIIKNSLTEELANSDVWQPVEAGGQCMLIIEVLPVGKEGFISCKIMDATTAFMYANATELSKLKPKKLQKACKSLAEQLLNK